MADSTQKNLAVFIDFENFGRHEAFDTKLLIDKLKERGRLIIKRAYADWGRFPEAKRPMLENSVELIELPSHSQSKNSADIKLVVDALETAITKEYIDIIVVVSGDSDYTPLISKLREYNKYVIVIGSRKRVSNLLVGYCDELIYYSSLAGKEATEEIDVKIAYNLLTRAIHYLEDQGVETRSSQVKSYMKQLDSSFNESNYGFSQFKLFLERARQKGLVSLEGLEHGDYLVSLSSKDNLRRNTIAQNLDDEPKKPSSSSLLLQNTNKEVQEYDMSELLYLIYWAIKINQFGDQIATISHIASTIRGLDPSFELKKYGYSKSQGFKAIIKRAEDEQFVKLEYNNEKNHYYIYSTSKLEKHVKNHALPVNFYQLRYKIMAAKLDMTLNIGEITKFIKEAISIFEEATSKDEYLTIQQLFEACRQRVTERNEHIASEDKIINTLLKSRVFQDKNGDAIMDIRDMRIIAAIENVNVSLESCIKTIKREIYINFQEDIDAGILEELLILSENTKTQTGLDPKLSTFEDNNREIDDLSLSSNQETNDLTPSWAWIMDALKEVNNEPEPFIDEVRNKKSQR